jgi:ABC-type nickel/cobalt efflux system permease component RcnA
VIRRITAVLLTGVVLVLGDAGPAAAHPLGNFTTNQYAGLRVTPEGVDVDYVLDLAELPAFQARDQIDRDGDGSLSAGERAGYAGRTCAAVAGRTAIAVAGGPVAVTSRASRLTELPGGGGLTTLRVECALHAGHAVHGETTVDYRGGAFADRTGWREVTAVGDRTTLVRSTVLATTVSARLTSYPPGVGPIDVRTATLVVRPGGPPAGPAPGVVAVPTRGDRLTAWFTDLVGRRHLGVGLGLLAVLVATVLGAAHAVAPGHGKTVMAAYLISQRGRRRQALGMAATVAITHTLGVLVLAVAIATSLQVAPVAMYGWLRLASGALLACLGVVLLRRAVRGGAALVRAHDHGHHHHDGEGRHHDHDHGPTTALRSRTAVAMGFVGGLSPSPSAVVVLLGAAALGRAWFGVVLVVAYGVGMAATLTGIGLALARWGGYLQARLSDRWAALLTRRLPLAAATVILVGGLGLMAVSALDLSVL